MSLVTVLLFGAGVVLLIWGADLLVRGAAHLAAMAGISPPRGSWSMATPHA